MEKQLQILIGARIKVLRKQAGLTISQLAEMADIDGGFLNYIENGKKTPSLATLGKLSKALNLSLAEIFSKQIFKVEDAFDYQMSSQVKAILNGKTKEEKEKFLAVLKSLKSKEMLAAVFQILKKANRPRL